VLCTWINIGVSDFHSTLTISVKQVAKLFSYMFASKFMQ
jgi:hypothetical protein